MLRLTAVFEVLWIWQKLPIMGNTTYCGLLKQPYKHDGFSNLSRLISVVALFVGCVTMAMFFRMLLIWDCST